MPATPQITLTATLLDLAGSVVAGGTLKFYLSGFFSASPEIPGTAMIGKSPILATANGSGVVTQLLWGNDVISPAETFYCIVCSDSEGNHVWTQNYQLSGGGSQNLSDLSPYNPPPPLPSGLRWIEVAIASDGTALFDASLGSSISTTFHIVLTRNTVATFINLVPGIPYFVLVEQDDTGGWTFDWPDNAGNAMLVNSDPNASSMQGFVGVTVTGQLDAGSMMSTGSGSSLPQ
jgi:hypothetical protein